MRNMTPFLRLVSVAVFLSVVGLSTNSSAELSSLEIKRIERAIDKLKSEARGTKSEGYKEIQAVGASAGPYLVEALDDKTLTTESRKLICELLGELKYAGGAEQLIYNLKNKTETIRAVACKSLGKIGDAKAAEPLAGMLNDGNAWVREAAVCALMNFEINMAPSIVALLNDDADAVRVAAMKYLNKERDSSTAGAIRQALAKDKSDNVRAIAAKTLGELKDRGSIDVLMEAVTEDTYNAARQEAAIALGEIGDRKAVPALIKALHDDYKDIQLSAAQSLVRITGQDFGRDYDKWTAWYKAEKG